MKSDSRRIDSSTASAVTTASSANVAERRDQVPQRMRRKERREQDRDRRRRRARWRSPDTARAALSSQTTSSTTARGRRSPRGPAAAASPGPPSNGGTNTAAITSATPAIAGEQLDADQAFPIERGRGRRRCSLDPGHRGSRRFRNRRRLRNCGGHRVVRLERRRRQGCRHDGWQRLGDRDVLDGRWLGRGLVDGGFGRSGLGRRNCGWERPGSSGLRSRGDGHPARADLMKIGLQPVNRRAEIENDALECGDAPA